MKDLTNPWFVLAVGVGIYLVWKAKTESDTAQQLAATAQQMAARAATMSGIGHYR